MALRGALLCLAGCAALALAGAPAAADVKAGVEAWGRGDYAAAVKEWKGPAAKGDADAQFNLAQAYRLGRGVPEDLALAEAYYAKAAAQGHIKAADNYGLLLFQDGRREQAMPYVTAAAERGDPRAEYLLGVAHFNGDLVPRDWVRAYALLTLANSAGLPQAAPALTQMDEFIPLGQRQQAQSLAVDLKRSADAQRTSQLAAADLAAVGGEVTAPAPRQAAAAPPPAATPRPVPQAIPSAAITPSVAAAEAAVAEAMRATGTESPATAGADYARPSAARAPAPVRVAQAAPPAAARSPQPSSQAPASVPPPRAAAVAASGGPWKVQLGAFGVAGNAERLWAQVGGKGALAGKQRILEPAGKLTKLQAGGWPSRAAAQQACGALKSGGHDCIVTR
jgi:hypothetical protein